MHWWPLMLQHNYPKRQSDWLEQFWFCRVHWQPLKHIASQTRYYFIPDASFISKYSSFCSRVESQYLKLFDTSDGVNCIVQTITAIQLLNHSVAPFRNGSNFERLDWINPDDIPMSVLPITRFWIRGMTPVQLLQCLSAPLIIRSNFFFRWPSNANNVSATHYWIPRHQPRTSSIRKFDVQHRKIYNRWSEMPK